MKKYIPYVFLILVIGYFLFLIKPAILGQLSGTFQSTKIPIEYTALNKYLVSQNSFFRTLWVPSLQRFGFYNNTHPAVPAQNYFRKQDIEGLLSELNKADAEKRIQEAGIKYVIAPFDSQKEIYLKDRKYDDQLYEQVIEGLKSIKWLKKVEGFGRIAVFEVNNPRDHFWTDSTTLVLDYKFVSPVEYKVDVNNAKKGDTIVFVENFDAKWLARDVRDDFYDWPNLISSNPYDRKFNSFTLRKDGDYTLSIYYYPQILVNIGSAISLICFIVLIALLIYLKIKK